MPQLLRLATLASALMVCITLLETPADAQLKDFLQQGGGLLNKSKADEPELLVTLTPPDAQPGDVVTLNLTMTIPDGHYTYSTNPSFGGGTKISIEQAVGLTPVDDDFVADHPPKVVFEPLLGENGLDVEKYDSDVTWSRKYQIRPDAKREQVTVIGKLETQVCDASSCRPWSSVIQVALIAPAVPKGNQSSAEVAVESHPYRYKEIPEWTKDGPKPITLRFELLPETAKAGDEVTLSITAVLEDKWHTYSLTQDPENFASPTKISIQKLNGLKPIGAGFKADKEPEITDPLGDGSIQEVYHGTVTWSQRFEVLSSEFGIAGTIRSQVCDEQKCLPTLPVSFALGNVQREAASKSNGAAEPVAPPGADKTSVSFQPNDDDITQQGLIPFLIAAVVAGFAALLTPCVFPMIPITVSLFLKESEKEHHRPVRMASIYCFGIIGAFTVLGLLMAVLFSATTANQFANNPWLNLGIAGVLIFFGLNLLGLFEIQIPSWLLTWTSGKENQSGVVGVLFMALTFTLVSFTCTFAFIGFLLVLAAKGEYYWPILGLLAFSSAFALPFFFLALFPSFLKKLPKSGGWMNTVKVTMGLIECAAAFKFLSVADLAWNPVPVIFDYALVMMAWIVISLCIGLYLLGLFRLPHDTPSESIGVLRLVFAMTFLGFGGFLAIGVFGPEEPTSAVWEQIASFPPAKFEGGDGDVGPFLKHEGLKFALDFDKAVKYAEAKKLPLLLDFTGVNCVNCRKMERLMSQPHNKERLQSFVLVQLYTDNVPIIQDPQYVQELLQKNRNLQEHWFGDVTLPSYAVVTSDGKHKLAIFKGLELQQGQFADFLDDGLAKWKAQASQSAGTRMARR